jgi:serine/threonine-protein kinase HipA
VRGARLHVYRSGVYLGWLDAPIGDDFSFTYAQEYLEHHMRPLSLALPLQDAPIRGQVVSHYFDGLLPEGSERDALARLLRVSPHDTGALLAALGGECIGDLVILTEEMQNRGYHAIKSGYQGLSVAELSELLRPNSPQLHLADISNRISLAGAQAKIGLYHSEGTKAADGLGGEGWSLPYGLAASTHILKPQSSHFAHLVENEAFCMRLAAASGIGAAEVEVLALGEPALAVRRFDRARDEQGAVLRLHQEDCCQVLGVSALHKYQEDGGPGFGEISRIIVDRSSSVIEDMGRLIDIAVFNFLIGNCDAHGKNFSVLESGADGLRLSPAYDLVSTTYYRQLSRTMAMSIGTQHLLDRISLGDFRRFGEQIGVREALVASRLERLADGLSRAIPEVTESLLASGCTAVRPLAKHVKQEAQARAAQILG